MNIFFDRKGNPISIEEWGQLCHDDAYRRVAVDDVGEACVSTIWTGLDPGARVGGWTPRIFETAVFGLDGGWLEEERYSTEAEALAGHEATVRAVKARHNPS